VSRPSRLTTTSYAILGLLGVRSWSTYELTRQMDRSLGRIWPRAQSKLYEEPRKLVEHGLATAREERVGERPRTVYSITGRGRRALRSWLAEPSAGPPLESEHLLKVFFAEHGTREDLLATLASARAWAVERNAGNLEAGAAYAAGAGPFPERAAHTLLVGAFLTDYYRLVGEWADWATGIVAQWPEDVAGAVPDPAIFAEVLGRARWSETADSSGVGEHDAGAGPPRDASVS
jgi:DNA-binding PadR family transcriptional regulator